MSDSFNKTEFDYLLDNNKLIITKNAPDIYVKLRTELGEYMVPVSMPRRNPSLQFDLDNPGDDLWLYLAQCKNKLTSESIVKWFEEEKLKVKNPTSVTDKLLMCLLTEKNVCYQCFAEKITNPNPQKNIQYLRDRGYIICTHKVFCSKCGKEQTTYSLTPILSCAKQSYEIIPYALKKKICQLFDYKDSYTGIRNTEVSSHIPDHKFPEDRWDENTPVNNSPDMSEEEIKEKFQLLNPQTNMQKQRFCSECIRTKQRGFPFGIKFYYAGKEYWDSTIPEKGAEAEKRLHRLWLVRYRRVEKATQYSFIKGKRGGLTFLVFFYLINSFHYCNTDCFAKTTRDCITNLNKLPFF